MNSADDVAIGLGFHVVHRHRISELLQLLHDPGVASATALCNPFQSAQEPVVIEVNPVSQNVGTRVIDAYLKSGDQTDVRQLGSLDCRWKTGDRIVIRDRYAREATLRGEVYQLGRRERSVGMLGVHVQVYQVNTSVTVRVSLWLSSFTPIIPPQSPNSRSWTKKYGV